MSEFRRYLLGVAAAVAAIGFLGASAPASAAEPAGGATKSANDLVLRGDAVCTQCHTAEMTPHVLEIGKTTMGTTADLRTPTCTSCHGESLKHRNGDGMPDRTFDKKSTTPIAERNKACLTCHQGGERINWMRSPHQNNEVACTSCHKIHTAHDTVRDRMTQTEVCFTCHKTQRAEMRRPSRHPIDEGKVVCSDCHNPHGTSGPHLLRRDNVNDTCYTCHMEKRGPFLHSHEPVQEDCTLCHDPHGTTNPSLLKQRPPFLCQSCHEPQRHPGTYPDGTPILPGVNPATAQSVIFARGCMNCHAEIHGSNMPTESNNRLRH
jgi:DmsE family decaheme c-type cytochrome